LPTQVKSEQAKANYKNGVLIIEIPKLKQVEAKKKRIMIE
jgi:HSP20 family molecular chaperone IbpA